MSQQTTPAQPKQTAQSGLPALPPRSQQPMSDDTILVWREVKYHLNTQQHRMDAVYADFREVFNGWSKERFQNVHPEALRALKYALRTAGVCTGNIRKHSAEALADLAQLPCVENGVWPRPPQWDHAELSTTAFKPGSEAKFQQQRLLDMLKSQQGQIPPARQILAPQQPAGAPSQAPPGQRSHPQNAPPSARQPAPAPAQAPQFQVPPVPVRMQAPGPVLAQLPPLGGIPTTGGPQRTTQGSQQQRGPWPLSNQTQSNPNAAQPPPPYSRHDHGINNNPVQLPASQPQFINPFAHPNLPRTATNSGSQGSAVPQMPGLGAAQNDHGNGDGDEEEEDDDDDDNSFDDDSFDDFDDEMDDV